MSEEKETVVIDVGSSQIVGGFQGEDTPRTINPTIVGYQKEKTVLFYDCLIFKY